MTSSILHLTGNAFVVGKAYGEILACNTELSFWGGVEPATGEVIDRHHPLSGQLLQGKILVLPGGRGSCSGSGVLLEMLVNGEGPDAIVVSRSDDIITLGVWIAKEMFNIAIPVIMLKGNDFKKLSTRQYASIAGGEIHAADQPLATHPQLSPETKAQSDWADITLNDYDKYLLNGDKNQAAQVAMKIILHMAQLMGATKLINVNQVHIDGCIYTGKASLAFAQKLVNMGGDFAVPTTLNAISVDYRRWKVQGVPSEFGEQASALADAYVDMGAKSTFTCAPYQLETAPQKNQQIAWAESNAVIFANSVLGARTIKYPDFLDACIALTGRAPLAGAHLQENRKATMHFDLKDAEQVDDLFYPLLGYYIGEMSGNHIPIVTRMELLSPDQDDLRAFSAAFATTSSAPMFHMEGITPEAKTFEQAVNANMHLEKIELNCADLYPSWQALSTVNNERTDLVSLGNPHFSLNEFKKLAALCKGNKIAFGRKMYITAGRTIVAAAQKAGYLEVIIDFGAEVITDTCWCMIKDPIISFDTKVICTNSAKYAHYGPGMTGRKFKLLSLYDCVQEVITETSSAVKPSWMSQVTA